MSATIDSENITNSTDKKVRQRKPRVDEAAQFRTWLDSLGLQSPPKLHINGPQHPIAPVVVDFGTPLNEPVKMTAERSADLIGHIRATTKSLFSGDIAVRVQNDGATGIWWATVG